MPFLSLCSYTCELNRFVSFWQTLLVALSCSVYNSRLHIRHTRQALEEEAETEIWEDKEGGGADMQHFSKQALLVEKAASALPPCGPSQFFPIQPPLKWTSALGTKPLEDIFGN